MNYGPTEFTLISVFITFVTAMVFSLCVSISVTNQSHKRDEELHERINKLETAMQIKRRRDRSLERRVKQLEKINKREKTNETSIRNTRSSSYDAGSRQRSRHTRTAGRARRRGR